MNESTGVLLLFLSVCLTALLLSYLDLPDLLSMVRTCKSVHALFKSRELFILSNHAVPKLVSFLSCLAPLKAKVFVGQEGKDVPSTQRFERVVLTGAQSVTVAYKVGSVFQFFGGNNFFFVFKGNFVPVAFRFKSLGGNRESVLPIKSVHASDVRKNSLDWHFDLDRPVVDASWCSAFIGAPLQSCVFTFGFSGPVTLTDFQMRGVTREVRSKKEFVMFGTFDVFFKAVLGGACVALCVGSSHVFAQRCKRRLLAVCACQGKRLQEALPGRSDGGTHGSDGSCHRAYIRHRITSVEKTGGCCRLFCNGFGEGLFCCCRFVLLLICAAARVDECGKRIVGTVLARQAGAGGFGPFGLVVGVGL